MKKVDKTLAGGVRGHAHREAFAHPQTPKR